MVLPCMSTLKSVEYWPQSELVSSQWVSERIQDNNVKIVEVIYDSKNRGLLNTVPGGSVLDWNEDIEQTDYEDPHRQNEKYHTAGKNWRKG